jgi:hypothetical protein
MRRGEDGERVKCLSTFFAFRILFFIAFNEAVLLRCNKYNSKLELLAPLFQAFLLLWICRTRSGSAVTFDR